MKVIAILSWQSDGSGKPWLEFFPDYRIRDAAEYAAQQAALCSHVEPYEVPTFDPEASNATT